MPYSATVEPMDRNPDRPPAEQGAAPTDDDVRPQPIERTSGWKWARRVALVFAVMGITAGVLVVVGPVFFGTPTGSLASFILPVVLGSLVIATHRLNYKRLRDPSATYSRGKLLTFNVLLLAFFALAFIQLYQFGQTFRYSPVLMATFLFWGPLPFAISALYLALPNSKTRTIEPPPDPVARKEAREP
jgi:hypothetical protein